MHNCSKLFVSNISKPAISKTPIKVLRALGRSKATFNLSTNAPNILSYNDLASASILNKTCSTVLACTTTSRPALTLGLIKPCWKSLALIPRTWHVFSQCKGSGS